ncbi:hypothetical protein GCK72_023053 [Caenorhabditis remanei]|uniref:Uncharacterized protein n=1 Tax=Caenorhabditis remanei TaxID=31234 RepID=A0A6A5FVM9_CAERE|nr:hypothetical protein GCK72_023053 [Caenorhabditis remanei]KAF1746596.1 hypothetical protein GCK72_023053 [Caenorhabditis remanei]
MWHDDQNSLKYSNLYLPPVSQLRNYVMSQSPADGGAFYERQHVPPMSTNTQPIHSIGEISTGEEEENVFNSISGESEVLQENPEAFNNVLLHMQAAPTVWTGKDPTLLLELNLPPFPHHYE